MIYVSIALFALAAVGGAVMLSYLLRDKHIPKGIAVLHGLLAVTALVLLLIYSITATEGAWWSILAFVTAAVGGLILLYKDLTGKAPKWLGIAHGLIAVSGFILLLGFVL